MEEENRPAHDEIPRKEATLFDPVICADPEQAHVSLRKGNALGTLDRDEEALAVYEEAIHLVPQDADYYIGKGEVLASLTLHKAATEAYEKAARLEEDM